MTRRTLQRLLIGGLVYDARRRLRGEVVTVGRKAIVCRTADGRRWFANHRDLRPSNYPQFMKVRHTRN